MVARRKRFADVSSSHYFLLEEIYKLLLEKISGNFTDVLNLGAHRGEILLALKDAPYLRFENITHLDMCDEMLKYVRGEKIVVADDNFDLGVRKFDLVISGMFLHHVNNLVDVFSCIHETLKPDGICVASLFGPETLSELKQAIFNAEMDLGFVPRVSPFIHIKDAGRLLQRVGFSVPVVASEKIVVEYSSVMKLFDDIHATAQSGAMFGIDYGLSTRRTIDRIIKEYERLSNGQIKATFEIVILTALKKEKI
ncbi:methyltransferase domain protein [Neorickettsia helminthoeca str. Oregon]|uniref:Methyltransferase domain protein n=2 Tax=Neorickettsia helminthoeca TaxID=33994 RepID=X5GX14_9RICK|nr:methyltransferase domain protein [Neorickettsia helminthoeca str. Oregon]